MTDVSGAWDRERFDVVVSAVDDAPDVVDIPDQEIMEGDVFTSFDLDDYVTEVDGDVVDWSYSSGSDEVSGFVHHIMLSGEGSDYDLGFGFLEDATDGYDEGIDFYAPPAPPSGFDAALAWNFERYYTQVLSLDGDYSEHVWDIQLQYPADNLIELSWDNTGWSDKGTFILQDAFGGFMFDIDMTQELSLIHI